MPYRVYCIEKDYASGTVRENLDFLVHTNHDLADEGAEAFEAPSYHEFAREDEDDPGTGLGSLEESITRRACLADKWRAETKNAEGAAQLRRLKQWVQQPETTNECTQYTCIMDPESGEIVDAWVRLEPPYWDD